MELKDRQQEAFAKLFSNISIPDFKSADDVTLSETRRILWLTMDNLVQAADTEKRELTPDESLAYDYAESRITRIDHERRKRDDNRPQRVPFDAVRVTSNGMDDINPREKKTVGFIGATYRQLFHPEAGNGGLGDGQFKTLNEFFRCVASGKYDPRLEQRSMIEGVGAIGGVAVPNDFLEQIWSVPLEQSIIASRARMFPIRRGTSITIPQWDSLDHSSNIAGFEILWEAEESTRTEQDGQLKDIEITAYGASIYCSVSNRLLNDGIDFDRQLGEILQGALSFGLDDYYLNGNGVGKPLGIRNAPSRITLNRTTANQILYADILNMYSRVHPACMKNAVWITTPTTVPYLCQLKDSGNNSVWMANAAAGMPPTILNLPVLFTEKLPGLGNEADLMLVDPSQYAITPRQDILIEKSNAPKWYEDKTSFRIKVRTNGRPIWTSACTPKDSGGATLSWCVVLD